jgi:hypothetical protein
MDASGVLTWRYKRNRFKWSQNSSRQGQEKVGTMHMRQRGGRDGLMVESKSSVVVVAVLFVIVVGSGDLGWAALAGCHWLGSAGSAG